MTEYSHRDQRAHRDVERALLTIVGTVVALVGLALYVPLPFAGYVGVIGLVAAGAGYVIWSERMLGRYTADLRIATNPAADGFTRAELGAVGTDEANVGRPTTRSPNIRRKSATPIERAEEPLPAEGTRSSQP